MAVYDFSALQKVKVDPYTAALSANAHIRAIAPDGTLQSGETRINNFQTAPMGGSAYNISTAPPRRAYRMQNGKFSTAEDTCAIADVTGTPANTGAQSKFNASRANNTYSGVVNPINQVSANPNVDPVIADMQLQAKITQRHMSTDDAVTNQFRLAKPFSYKAAGGGQYVRFS